MMCKYPLVRKAAGTCRTDKEGLLLATPLPCGKCLHCRINKSREYTHRIMLEASCYGDNCFFTGTFNPDNCPSDKCVDPAYLKNFLKRVRRRLNGKTFRYFAVGEYGDTKWRPHYHVIFFGLGFLDYRKIYSAWNYTKNGVGFATFDAVNVKTAGYVAGYTIKKLTKEKDPFLEGRKPEFMRSSRKDGGIGLPAIKKIAQDLNNNKYWKPTVISELKHGGKSWPLGRYLTDKLSELQGVTEFQRDQHLLEYQQKLFDKTMKGGFYYDNIMMDSKQKRRTQEWKHNNYKRKRECPHETYKARAKLF